MKKKLISILLCLTMCLSAISVTAWAEEKPPVEINDTNFPDEVFREYVSVELDKDEDGKLSAAEIADVTVIYAEQMGIASLEGIEFFTALRELHCGQNELTSLDVGQNTALEVLYCNQNELTSLDVSQNTALKELNCFFNHLTSLDVSANKELEKLYCNVNPLGELDVSKNIALKELNCNQNELVTLDVSKNTELTGLSFALNLISDVDLSKNTELQTLICAENELTGLDLSSNTKLTYLHCGHSPDPENDKAKLTELDISCCPALEELHCEYHALTVLDLSKNTALTYLDCIHNELTELDVSHCPVLEGLHCAENAALSGLNLDGSSALLALDCGYGNLSELNVSDCTLLEMLACGYNDLTELDVSRNTALTYLDCSYNGLTELDVSGLTELTDLICTDNHLTELDIRATQALLLQDPEEKYLDFFGNQSDGSVTVYMTAEQKTFYDGIYAELERNSGVLAVVSPTMPSSMVTVSVTFMADNSMLNFCVDVKASDYYYDSVLWAYKNGICNGIDNVHFGPNAPVTRAQVVTFLWRAAGKPVVDYAMNMADVTSDAYYAEAVRWALAEGITKGTSDTTFSPDAVCTRGQIVTFLARFAGVKDAETVSAFTDVKPTDFFAAAVKWAKDNGVTSGTSETKFSPNDNCTRAQVVTFLYRLLGR